MKTNRNSGMALVSSIILIAIIAIMSGALLEMSYLSYSRKVVERRSNETFYTAEASLDTIKAAVQNSVAKAIPEAKSSGWDFAKEAYKILTGSSVSDITFTEHSVDISETSPLYTFLYDKIIYKDAASAGAAKELKDDGLYYNGYSSGEKPTKIIEGITPLGVEKEINGVKYVGLGGDFKIGSVQTEAGGVRIKDVYIKFVNKQGYVAEIRTDIVINAPIYASDIVVPVGSYSMFAGNGIAFDNGDRFAYVHQEGNVYIGYLDTTTTSLDIYGKDHGYVYFSVGGSNIVINGDIYVRNGSTMIFTGGDGSEYCNIQVNGNIYLDNEATLLMANNINLVVKDIYADDGDGYKRYVGDAGLEDELSQFYPISEDRVSSDSKTAAVYTSDFNTNGRDIAEILQKLNYKPDYNPHNDPDAYDKRSYNVLSTSNTTKCGVYMLDVERDDKGFKNRAGDCYYVLSRSGDTWSCSKTGVYDDQIKCRPDDTKLKLVTKISYGGSSFDAEFASILNIPLVKMWSGSQKSNLMKQCYSAYDTGKSATYNSMTYKDLKTIEPFASNTGITAKIDWDEGMQSVDDLVTISNYPFFSDRKYRVPVDTKMDPVPQIVVTSDLTSIDTGEKMLYACGADKTFAGDGNEVVDNLTTTIKDENNQDVKACGFCVVVTNRDTLDIHIPSGSNYAGVFLTGRGIHIGDSAGYARGLSLLELAKHTSDNKGIDNKDNDVRKALEQLAKSCINPAWTESDLSAIQSYKDAEASGINLFDNLFNGGVSLFWERNRISTSSGSNSADTSKDFVENDNWEKNPDSPTSN